MGPQEKRDFHAVTDREERACEGLSSHAATLVVAAFISWVPPSVAGTEALFPWEYRRDSFFSEEGKCCCELQLWLLGLVCVVPVWDVWMCCWAPLQLLCR